MDITHLAPNLPGPTSPRNKTTDAVPGPGRGRARKLVLCFDGTGNEFKGDDSDSNILKLFRMLDRTTSNQYHYYQPGIGTYVVSPALSHSGLYASIKQRYAKLKDSAVGSSFDQHVVGGYRFLMRYYRTGDEIFVFGFSRGAYVARFLAEMLDHVGLLSHGNEEMVFFAWKAFSNWESRRLSPHDPKTRAMHAFLVGFRETFSRPTSRIRFLGLFDTVNSVPRFETAWMQRSKFPYTARTSARVVRHAVSIDERRAKFRQDLMYQTHGSAHARPFRRRSTQPRAQADDEPRPYRPSRSPSLMSRTSGFSATSDIAAANDNSHDNNDDDSAGQDVDELWFAGGHGDVGGGWPVVPGTKSASHVPLTWMVREASRAGLTFDTSRVCAMGCGSPVDSPSQDQSFRDLMHAAQTARLHDSLSTDCGMPRAVVLTWRLMEYLPFRRMDLQSDGSWRPIRWPLPRGEVRDVPPGARVHGSVVRRMQTDRAYRPGNLIVGGGGRGLRVAPETYGMGQWVCVQDPGDPVGEVWVRQEVGATPSLTASRSNH